MTEKLFLIKLLLQTVARLRVTKDIKIFYSKQFLERFEKSCCGRYISVNNMMFLLELISTKLLLNRYQYMIKYKVGNVVKLKYHIKIKIKSNK